MQIGLFKRVFCPQLLLNGKLNEDRCNQLFRELFNQAYPEMFGLTSNDQEQTGLTGHSLQDGREGIAEVDITIKNAGNRVAIIEALMLSGMNKCEVNKHICKLLGNNIQNRPMFLLVYGNAEDTEKLWSDYESYCKDEFTEEFKNCNLELRSTECFSANVDYLPELHKHFYFCNEMLKMTFEDRHKNQYVMYHIVLDIGKRGKSTIAAKGRKSHTSSNPSSKLQ